MVVVSLIRRAMRRPAGAGSPASSMVDLIIDSLPELRTRSWTSHAFRLLRQAVAFAPAHLSRERRDRNRSSRRRASPPGAHVARIRASLASEDRAGVQTACQALIDALVGGLPCAEDSRARAGATPGRRQRRAPWPLRARRRPEPGAHHRVDAHGGAQGRCSVQDVSAHADPRALPSPRLRALQDARNFPHRGLLQARVHARRTRSCARSRRRAISWVRIRPLPEERCNRTARGSHRVLPGSGNSPLQPRSLNRARARGDEPHPPPRPRSPTME